MSGRPADSRIALRLALRLAPAALLVTAAVGWILVSGVQRTLREQLAGRLELIASVAGGRLDEAQREVSAGLDELGDQLIREPEMIEALLLGGAAMADTAERLRHRVGLDTLELLNEEGSVLSSSQSGRTGLLDRAPLALPQGEVLLDLLATAGGERWVFESGHRLEVGSRSLFLSGGRFVDDGLLERIAGGEAVWLLVDGVQAATRAARESGVPHADLESLPAVSGADAVLEGNGARWAARARAVDGSDRALWVVALDRRPLETLERRIRTLYLVLTLAAGAVAGLSSIWIARTMTGPVDRLLRAVDAIASGEADYTFPATERDTFDRLATSFSRMQRSLEQQRERSLAAERVAAWQDVARHVAHEVKNPLAPIRLTVENLRKARDSAPERFEGMFRDGTTTILEEVDRLSRLVGEFSEFARLPQPVRRPGNLEAILERVSELFHLSGEVHIEKEFHGDLPHVQVDEDQMIRAFKNILGNAVEAMPEAPRRLRLRTGVDETFVRVEIADRGRGFTAEEARKIFEPYFTTKERGTGLGMAITYRIVTEHDGLITAENRPGGGARVVIRLPWVPRADGETT